MVQIYHVRPRDYLEMSLGVSSDLFIIQFYTNLFRCVFQKGKSVAMRFLFVSVAEKKNSKGQPPLPLGHRTPTPSQPVHHCMPTKWPIELETAPHPYTNPGADSTFSILLTVSLEDETLSPTPIVVHRQRVEVDVIDGERIVRGVSHIFTDPELFEEYKRHVDGEGVFLDSVLTIDGALRI